jgi:hypothetical protein
MAQRWGKMFISAVKEFFRLGLFFVTDKKIFLRPF